MIDLVTLRGIELVIELTLDAGDEGRVPTDGDLLLVFDPSPFSFIPICNTI